MGSIVASLSPYLNSPLLITTLPCPLLLCLDTVDKVNLFAYCVTTQKSAEELKIRKSLKEHLITFYGEMIGLVD